MVSIKAGLQSGFHKSREAELVSLQGDEPGSEVGSKVSQFTGRMVETIALLICSVAKRRPNFMQYSQV